MHRGGAGPSAHRGGGAASSRGARAEPRGPGGRVVTDDNRTKGESRRVRIREVGPRDGFQNEPETIPTADKIRLIDALGRAGFKRIEVASFVRPDVIPQLSDGVHVLRGIDLPHGVARMVLVPNSRGLGNALAVRDLFEEVALFVSASQTHNRRNINRRSEEHTSELQSQS